MTTRCNHCHFDNPDGMRFCGNCGNRLNESGRDFPGFHQGQIRHVTILFADLAGYTQAANRLDSEVLYELVQQYTDLLSREIDKFEGVVDKFTGDGLMALFGAPVSYENNPERALRAALEMQQSITPWCEKINANFGIELGMRIGIHAGPAVVGEIGSNIILDYTAIGETVNLAQRIEEYTLPGTILTSETVFRTTHSLFEFQAIPNIQLKGFADPLNCYRLIAIKQRPIVYQTGELNSVPMIGRQAELQTLLDTYEQVVKTNQGAFILINGEAGIGKSRLIQEFEQQPRTQKTLILHGNSLTYRRSVPYWIFSDLVDHFIAENLNTDQMVVNSRDQGLADASISGPDGSDTQYLRYLVSIANPHDQVEISTVNLESEGFREHLFQAIRRLLFPTRSSGPLVWILEDLHWIDDASFYLLCLFLTLLEDYPLLIIGAQREGQNQNSDDLEIWSSSHLGESYTKINLSKLGQEESQSLLTALLRRQKISKKLTQKILERAGGIPLFMEEILRMVLENREIDAERISTFPTASLGEREFEVPPTIFGLIQARFDNLSPYQRRLLQIASVAGHHFDPVLIQPLLAGELSGNLPAALVQLERREFIRHTPGHSQGEYAFRHVLLTDAIYQTMLKKERGRLHGQIANAIETLYPENIFENTEILARHYSWSDQTEKALTYLIAAGQKAAATQVWPQARRQFEHALSLLASTKHTLTQALEVHLGLADVYLVLREQEESRKQAQIVQDLLQSNPDSTLHIYRARVKNLINQQK